MGNGHITPPGKGSALPSFIGFAEPVIMTKLHGGGVLIVRLPRRHIEITFSYPTEPFILVLIAAGHHRAFRPEINGTYAAPHIQLRWTGYPCLAFRQLFFLPSGEWFFHQLPVAQVNIGKPLLIVGADISPGEIALQKRVLHIVPDFPGFRMILPESVIVPVIHIKAWLPVSFSVQCKTICIYGKIWANFFPFFHQFFIGIFCIPKALRYKLILYEAIQAIHKRIAF